MGKKIGSHATVLLSGGQDSATCLAWSLDRFDSVDAISFDYNQRHKRELEAAIAMSKIAKVQHRIIPVPSLAMTKTALTSYNNSVTDIREDGLPATFVPGRNILFLSIAASLFEESQKEIHLVTGVCQTDYSGYPDCRKTTIDSLAVTLYLGINRSVEIHTPLMFLTKAESVLLARELELGWELLANSWTCYQGGKTPCNKCPSCVLRLKGFLEAGYEDPST
jgi:7-cyano-7-deazaguanine synthase